MKRWHRIALCCAVLAGAIATARAGTAEPLAIERAAQVSLGGGQSCAVTATGGVRCWGANDQGQLGDGTTVARRVPAAAGGLEDAANVAAGYGHTCALTTAGGVQCWGANASGQLGAPSADHCSDFPCSRTPVGVTGLSSGVAQLAAGFSHSCAVMTDGALQCWGFNLYGNLGDGTMTDRQTPIVVSGLGSGAVSVAPGDIHTCALLDDATVRCWGSNVAGNLGDGTTTNSSLPVTVCRDTTCAEPFGNVVQLASGFFHTCALTTAANVYCWGSNDRGQLGVATAEECPTEIAVHCSKVPLLIEGLEGVAAVAAGGWQSCALLESGAVDCWGGGVAQPVAIASLGTDIASIAVGVDYLCGVTTAGEVLCMGANDHGQLGDGTTVDRDTAHRVWSLSNRGDADCDRSVTSNDAAYVLQLEAQLLKSLPCPSIAATPGAPVTSRDALLILQFTAGLLG